MSEQTTSINQNASILKQKCYNSVLAKCWSIRYSRHTK